jgi:hypothetical protein
MDQVKKSHKQTCLQDFTLILNCKNRTVFYRISNRITNRLPFPISLSTVSLPL